MLEFRARGLPLGLGLILLFASFRSRGNAEAAILQTPSNGKVIVAEIPSHQKTFTLKCQSEGRPEAAFSWFQVTDADEVELSDIPGVNVDIPRGEIHVDVDLLGAGDTFRCSTRNESHGEPQETADFVVVGVRAYLAFRVDPLPKSVGVPENRDLNLTCAVSVYVDPADVDVQWFYHDTPEDLDVYDNVANCTVGERWKSVAELVEKGDSEDQRYPRLSLDATGGIKGDLLRILRAEKSHRRGYKCVAVLRSAGAGHRPGCATTFVRVKFTLAALWPFLGIVAEVIVLCATIFLCEKYYPYRSDPDE